MAEREEPLIWWIKDQTQSWMPVQLANIQTKAFRLLTPVKQQRGKRLKDREFSTMRVSSGSANTGILCITSTSTGKLLSWWASSSQQQKQTFWFQVERTDPYAPRLMHAKVHSWGENESHKTNSPGSTPQKLIQHGPRSPHQNSP